MKPQTRNPQGAEIDSTDISSTELFTAFAEKRRQYVLTYLAQKLAAIHLGDVAEYIALKEDDPSHDWYQRILVDLHHQHVPALCDAGLVHYDEEAELLELAVDLEVITPYLELTDFAK